MAIQDRNLSVGTKLYARYKGQTHTAEVVARDSDNATGHPTAVGYRVEGKEGIFNSPSAAGTAITEKACNGWAFWSVGDGAENTGPVTSTKTRPAAKLTPAPKPQTKGRGRKAQTAEPPPAAEPEASNEARDDAPTATADDGKPVTCAECHETFPNVQAATEHYYATHGKVEEKPTE